MVMELNNVYPYAANILLVLLCYDALAWVTALIRHAYWMRKHEAHEARKCMRITHKLLLISSILSGLQVLVINLSWIYFKVYYGYHLVFFIIIAGVNIMMIHQYALLAMCTELEECYWPYLSGIMSKCMITPCYWLRKKNILGD
jgi:hypothetical protein